MHYSDNLPYAYCEQIGKEIRDISDEIPFDIPDSWEWIRFSNLVNFSMGKTPPRKETEYWENPIYPWVSIADMPADGTVISTKEKVNQFAADNTFKSGISPIGTLIMSFKLTVGKVSILGIDAFHNEAIISIFPFIDDDRIVTSYLFKILPLIAQNGDTKTAIKGATLNSDSLSNLLIPLPPIAEQRRIVAKITELEPCVTSYGIAETKLTNLNTTFPEALKKSILQEAVQGKLVPQNPDDEPERVLLQRIRAEKQALIKAGKIKKDKHESVIVTRDKIPYEIIDGKERCITDEVPFEIPDSWCWCKLSDIVSFIGGYAYNSSDFISSSQNQVLRLGNVKPDELKLSAKPVFISDALAEATVAFRCKTDDILLTMTGTRKKRDYFFTVRILCEEPPLFINQRVGCLRAYVTSMSHWLTWILKSETVLSQVFQYETGTANQGNLGAENIMKTLIPLPPLEELHRIVAKIEELIQYCDKL
ncbi:MAG: hypothetical protein E7495_10345 [Ruminococcus flavefaciens]|nr:hypothetical protein [Ruminococcus flavefaciens]